jgi:hypothetical protein
MIRASCFREIEEPFFDFEWAQAPDGSWYIGRSEDVIMFDKLAEKGYTVYVDQDLSTQVAHIGTFQFTNVHALPDEELRAIAGAQAA